MSLRPLEQWICDRCSEVVLQPDHGWIEWLRNEERGKCKEFRIVHHTAHSPCKPDGNCYLHARPPTGYMRLDEPLDTFLGGKDRQRVMPLLLSFVDEGPYLQPSYNGPRVEDLREWVDLTRRLTIPYYEEARQYMDRAKAGGSFVGGDSAMYHPANLQGFIKDYSH